MQINAKASFILRKDMNLFVQYIYREMNALYLIAFLKPTCQLFNSFQWPHSA